MSLRPRQLLAALLAVPALLLSVGAVSAHPLGNYTVSRAVAVRIMPGAVEVRYLVDMAEIPAFSAIQAMDADRSGAADPDERDAYAETSCAAAQAALVFDLDGSRRSLGRSADERLTFPPGAGELETLRLECTYSATFAASDGEHQLSIFDRTQDVLNGWREVTVVADAGVSLLSSDVPNLSESEYLTNYPAGRLDAPPDVRRAMATFRVSGSASGSASAPPASVQAGDTASDPLATLLTGELSVPLALLAILLAIGLGAGHALSPGHGKTLVAAYVIGSNGTRRQAAALGLTVAVTHTAGVFVIGALTLLAGELFAPERVIAWLSVVSGVLVAVLGATLVWRVLRSRDAQAHEHAHPHPHGHGHGQPHAHAETSSVRLTPRGVIALGLAGGLVPSASALIVLLAAVSTGRLVFGLGLIVAFGLGMALVLGGLAVATAAAREMLRRPGGIARSQLVQRAGRFMPLASAGAVLVIGLAVTATALARLG